MADITASMVKELRGKTGAGMMDAKKALTECNGDMAEATDWLRKKGLSKAEKKSSRAAAEGLVAITTDGNKAAVIEVNSETDFVSRNAEFQSFVSSAAEVALKAETNDIEDYKDTDFAGGKKAQEALTDLIAKIGENMTLRRVSYVEVSEGIVAGYVHNAAAPNMGKIGVLVGLESSGDKDQLNALGKQIAMHVAAAFPQFLDRDSVDTSALDRERAVLTDQAREAGKPEEIIEKMVEGRIRKYYEEVCLVEQTFVVDGETKVADLLKNAEKEVGAPVKITEFVRLQLGEGVEKEETDFAAEVAAAVNG